MRRPWWLRRNRTDSAHAHPKLERASAELYGRMEALINELDRVVSEREDELGLREREERDRE